MEKWKKRSVELLTSLAFGSRGNPSVVPYYPQKTAVGMPEEKFFRRGIPEKHGISSKRLYNMLCELEGERRANLHSLMILCDGEVICECAPDGYGVNIWHVSHSMSKTVCGMIIGILIDRGLISKDDKAADIFPEIAYRDKKFPLITVEHLLTMTAGVDFAEAGAITESAWTQAFFSASVKYTPGTKFYYNSMNTYILARIAERVSGKDFTSLAAECIFAPMGIYNYLCEKGPEGTEKAGWGLYMSAESWAKLGVMFACGGVFMGRRVLPEWWVKESGRTKALAPEIKGSFNYAYQTWTSRRGDEVLFNGMFGQNVWICPGNNIVAVMTGGNNELFQESPALEIIRRYLGGEISDQINRKDLKVLREKESLFFESRRWVHPREKKRGLLYWLGIKPRTYFDDAWTPLLGNYLFGSNNMSILPLILRAMQNSLDSTLEAISLHREGDSLFLAFFENGTEIRFKVGFYEYESSVIDVRGESYLVKVMGESTVNIKGEREYKIEMLFPETSCTRRLFITSSAEDRIRVDFSETPNNRIIDNMISGISGQNSTLSFAVDLLERRFGEGIVTSTAAKAFNPMLIGANTAFDSYTDILSEENRRTDEESNRVRLIRAVVDRFFKEDDGNTTANGGERRGKEKKKVIPGIIEKISARASKRTKM